MVEKQQSSVSKQQSPMSPMSPKNERERYAYLRAEAKAPYRLLRRFIYVAFGASGFIGALVFLGEVMTFHNMANAVPNFALQLGVVALMVWLIKVDKNRDN